MIPEKDKGVTYFAKGSGRPFEMNEREPIEKDDAERQKPLIINLSDLNGQTFEKGMPNNYHRKPGRKLVSFTEYWSPEESSAAEDGFDIE